MQSISITASTTLWFILYGIINNQITIRICKEYFTIFHRQVINTDNITLIALAWGVLATWWLGILMGVIITFFVTTQP